MCNAISIVIPTFNGQYLLKNNLSKIFVCLKNNDEILISDDFSADTTKDYLVTKYNLKLIVNHHNYFLWQGLVIDGQKKIIFTLLLNKFNRRFGANCNQAFKIAKNNLVFLLNNDVVPKNKNILEILSQHFIVNKNVFGVSCKEIETSQNQVSGKNKIWFEKGRFFHCRDKKIISGSTAWVGGGSCMIDKEKFLALGGFDKIFYPAYWEDIDLSFQARKRGWLVLFEEKALVYHNHETTNKEVFGQEKIDQMSWNNGTKFILKNANLWQKLQFLFFSPYWLVKRKNFLFVILILFFLVILIRFWQFGQIPRGFFEDEVAIGYNGFAIFQQRRDEWLEKLPISFRSFGDYKAPFVIYLNGLFTFFFGLKIGVVRLPSLIFSLLSVFFFVQLIKQVFFYLKVDDEKSNLLAWTGGLFLLMNPAHFLFSRIAFEVIFVFCFLNIAFYYFFHFLNSNYKLSFLISSLFFSLSLYTYHSSKIFVPLMIVFLVFNFGKKIWTKKNLNIILLIILINGLFLYPLIKDSFFGPGLTRAGASFLFNKNYSLIDKSWLLLKNFFGYFNLSYFIFGNNGGNWRHGTNFLGIIYPSTLFLFLFGLIKLVQNWLFNKNQLEKKRKIAWFLVVFFFLSILPSIITLESPHIIRSFLCLIPIMIISLLGLNFFLLEIKNFYRSNKLFIIVLVLEVSFFGAFSYNYFNKYPKKNIDAFQEGYQEIFQEVNLYLKGLDGRKKVSSVFITDKYGHSYIYALFFNQIKPIAYHQGALYQYQFFNKFGIGDLERKQALIITDFDNELPIERAEKVIYGVDGKIRFKIYLSNDLKNEK